MPPQRHRARSCQIRCLAIVRLVSAGSLTGTNATLVVLSGRQARGRDLVPLAAVAIVDVVPAVETVRINAGIGEHDTGDALRVEIVAGEVAHFGHGRHAVAGVGGIARLRRDERGYGG